MYLIHLYILITILNLFSGSVGHLSHLYEVYTIFFFSVYRFCLFFFFLLKCLLCFCPASIRAQTIFFYESKSFIFCCQPLKLEFSFQGEERRHKQAKQTNKQKKPNFCFFGSEAEAHDVISDANVLIYFYLSLDECLTL